MSQPQAIDTGGGVLRPFMNFLKKPSLACGCCCGDAGSCNCCDSIYKVAAAGFSGCSGPGPPQPNGFGYISGNMIYDWNQETNGCSFSQTCCMYIQPIATFVGGLYYTLTRLGDLSWQLTCGPRLGAITATLPNQPCPAGTYTVQSSNCTTQGTVTLSVADPPATVTITGSGFTSTCAAWNGSWVLHKVPHLLRYEHPTIPLWHPPTGGQGMALSYVKGGGGSTICQWGFFQGGMHCASTTFQSNLSSNYANPLDPTGSYWINVAGCSVVVT